MPDVCDLILDDHEVFRRRFAELDDERRREPATVSALWESLAEHLERHAAAEEHVFYPAVLDRVPEGEHEAHHAIRDHNKIRDAVRRVADAEPGSEAWWSAVDAANEENSDHMAEEERGPLSAFRQAGIQDLRKDLGLRFVAFNLDHAGGRALDSDDVDPDEYVQQHGAG
ncbi:MAG: hemerythrin domain-containing protein [Acidimicrobiales bacterium]|nr:hemerythrin domain-containing protein [Acidimicrobiales bacterium]